MPSGWLTGRCCGCPVSSAASLSLLLSMVQPILIILVLAVALSAVLASRLSKHIIKPVLAIDLEHPEDSDTYEELTPLLSRIKQQNQTIAQQMAQLRQKQNEFTAITENMSEGFLLLDRQGRILSHNSGALRLLHAAAPEERASYLTLNRTERFRQAVDAALTGRRDEQLVDLGGRCCQLLANPVIQDGAGGRRRAGHPGCHRAGTAGGAAPGVHRQCIS